MIEKDNKKALVISQYFPPRGTIGGSIRTVKFMKYCHPLGWTFEVLTVTPDRSIGYIPAQSGAIASEVPLGTVVHQIPPLNARKYDPQQMDSIIKNQQQEVQSKTLVEKLKASRRKLTRWLLIPDLDILWALPAVRVGFGILKESEVALIITVLPPHSTGIVGLMLKLLTGKPILIDFKDDWVDTRDYIEKPGLIRWIERRMEWAVVHWSDYIVTVTEASLTSFRKRYPKEPAEKFVLITNGCDLAEFQGVQSSPASRFTMICASGSISPSYRDITPFLIALENVLSENPVLRDKINVEFLGPGLRQYYDQFLCEHQLVGIVHEVFLSERKDYVQKLRSADLLLAFQVVGFSTSISGTLYEYWATGGPPILLVSEPGATFSFVQENSLGAAFESSQIEPISHYLQELLQAWEYGNPVRIQTSGIERYDRKVLASRLCALMDSCLVNIR